MTPNTECFICKTPIYRIPSRLTDHNVCSYSCRNKYFSKEKSFAWKGGPNLYRNRRTAYERKKRLERKEMAVAFLGGKCENCGYDSCLAAMDFHHINPLQKDVNINSLCSWKRIKKELGKCILLCSNCHREIHWKERYET